MELRKDKAADGHALRAMAYQRLRDPARAQSEMALARQALDPSKHGEDTDLMVEAQSRVATKETGR